MSQFWAGLCSSARKKPLDTLLDIAYASCGLTVSSAKHVPLMIASRVIRFKVTCTPSLF
jgi:hypothetical protein